MNLIFCTSKENHIHMIAASTDRNDLRYLLRMMQKECGKDMEEMTFYSITEVIKDVYGGVNYEKYRAKRRVSEDENHF